MLTESKIIFPLHDNADNPTDLGRFELALVSAFGGFTRIRCNGAWYNEEEQSIMYDENFHYTLASDWSSEVNRANLRNIAMAAATGLDQECIYICISGIVEMIEPMPLLKTAA